MNQTLVINLLSGPGVGKSTLCALIFSNLKIKGINCEMATEYAKDVVWEESFKKLDNQIYIFGKQHARINRLLNKVDVIITDSPLINSIVYDKSNNEKLKDLIIYEFKKLRSINFFVSRKFKYEESGRTQNKEQAIEVDKFYKNILIENDIPYIEVDPDNLELVINNVTNELRNRL